MITARTFQSKLLRWFDKAGRHDLPWQQNKTPYRVWVSEIMLQQTQVNTVIPYFNKFIKRFPTIKHLACAEQDEVFHYWSGLGFYARARNLHKTAKIVYENFNGRFPNTIEGLCELPGIGRSTAGAILSLASNISAPILDGNVKRVLTRVFMIEGYPEDTKPKKQLWQLAETLSPSDRCGDFNQAMMDLGATLCAKSSPSCQRCPFKTNCQAHLTDNIADFPFKKTKTKVPKRETYFLIFYNKHNEILLEKRPPTGIWGSLWSFPECNQPSQLQALVNSLYGVKVKNIETLPSFKHLFTHFELTIHPRLIFTQRGTVVMESNTKVWYNPNDALPGGIPKPVEKILQKLSTHIGQTNEQKSTV